MINRIGIFLGLSKAYQDEAPNNRFYRGASNLILCMIFVGVVSIILLLISLLVT